MQITWDWGRTLWTKKTEHCVRKENRQRWALEFLAAFQVYWCEAQIRTRSDPGMSFETGTSWVTVALDMYFTTDVQLPAALERKKRDGRTRGEGEEEQRRTTRNVRDVASAGLKACGGLRDQVSPPGQSQLRVKCWTEVEGPWPQPSMERRNKLCRRSQTTHL